MQPSLPSFGEFDATANEADQKRWATTLREITPGGKELEKRRPSLFPRQLVGGSIQLLVGGRIDPRGIGKEAGQVTGERKVEKRMPVGELRTVELRLDFPGIGTRVPQLVATAANQEDWPLDPADRYHRGRVVEWLRNAALVTERHGLAVQRPGWGPDRDAARRDSREGRVAGHGSNHAVNKVRKIDAQHQRGLTSSRIAVRKD